MRKNEDKLFDFLNQKDNTDLNFNDVIKNVDLDKYKKKKSNSFKFVLLSTISAMSVVLISGVVYISIKNKTPDNGIEMVSSLGDAHVPNVNSNTSSNVENVENLPSFPPTENANPYSIYDGELIGEIKQSNQESESSADLGLEPLKFKDVFINENDDKLNINEGPKIYEVSFDSTTNSKIIGAYIDLNVCKELNENNYLNGEIDGSFVDSYYRLNLEISYQNSIKWLEFVSNELPNKIENYQLCGIYSLSTATVTKEITEVKSLDIKFKYIYSHRMKNTSICVVPNISTQTKWFISEYNEEDIYRYQNSNINDLFKKSFASIVDECVVISNNEDLEVIPEFDQLLEQCQLSRDDNCTKYDYEKLTNLISNYKKEEK